MTTTRMFRTPSLRQLAACAISVVLLSVAAPSATAQTPAQPTPAQLAEARSLFEQGLQLVDQERWGEALQFFRRSAAITERPSTMYNIANALYRSGRPTEAIAAFERFLQIADPAAPERVQAQTMLATARASVAHLGIGISPPTAELRLDGQLVAGTGAQRTLTLDPGHHTLQLAAEGYIPDSREISPLPGAADSLSIALRERPRRPTRLVVTSIEGAHIRLDGAEIGVGRAEVDTTPGPHQLEVTAPEHQPLRRTVQVEANQTSTVEAPLAEIVRPGTRGGILSSPIFWTIAGVVVVAAGVTVGVVLLSGEGDPYPGSTGQVLEGLHAR